MKKILLAATLVILIIGFISIYLWQSKKADPKSEVQIRYEKIEIKSLDKTKSYGFVWIENQEIKTDLAASDIEEFILKNKEKWSKEEFEYPLESVSNGVNSYGAKKTTIKEDDFIIFLYLEIDNEFAGKYFVDLIK